MALSRRSLRRTASAVLALAAAVAFSSRPGLALGNAVPAEIQADLLSKLESYDRNFAARAGDAARVLLVVRSGNPRSELAAAEMKSALEHVERIGGLPHKDTVVPYPGADELARRCRAERVAVVYFTPGFDDELDAVRASFSDDGLLTLGASPDYVPRGIVLGFELESGKPRILLNLAQARRQGIQFSADLLRLMTVYQ